MVHLHPFDRLRLQRRCERLQPRGLRALAKVGQLIGGMFCILELLDDLRHRLTPELLAATAGDRLPPHLSMLPGGRR